MDLALWCFGRFGWGLLGGGLAGESEVRGGRGLGLEGFGRLGVFVEAGGVVFVFVLVLVLVCLCVRVQISGL